MSWEEAKEAMDHLTDLRIGSKDPTGTYWKAEQTNLIIAAKTGKHFYTFQFTGMGKGFCGRSENVRALSELSKVTGASFQEKILH